MAMLTAGQMKRSNSLQAFLHGSHSKNARMAHDMTSALTPPTYPASMPLFDAASVMSANCSESPR
eukprot:CAMPEP_0172748424 /NCGR_PEP_ID=MMETSP1074-20121228/145040_1 /TAXON_ID=2916 /ORGANISM="Ceratium fusus, Strain PA161109" /LENGTH=64 /DNA_ID=CAMNT_0013580155 /DNA_START=35 /DNA_END=229 /DNA_ORIENTATION=-